jgi:hypothetical protein
MRKLKIKTTRARDGYTAYLEDNPKKRATSTGNAQRAANNLAVRLFFGHNHRAQLPREELEKVIITRLNGDTFLATYDGNYKAVNAET